MDRTTQETYNNSAPQLAEFYKEIGTRDGDVARGLELAGSPQRPRIIELGCGDGRDAVVMAALTDDYIGVDYSAGLLEIAKVRVPNAQFIETDILAYDLPYDVDVIYAFASLLHLDQAEVSQVLASAAHSLKPGGIFYISLRHEPQYRTEIRRDRFGEREYFFYSPEIIEHLAGELYETAYLDYQQAAGSDWFTIALQKRGGQHGN